MSVHYKGCPYCREVFEIDARGIDRLERHLLIAHSDSESESRSGSDPDPDSDSNERPNESTSPGS
jgi:hypothetical protein